MKPGKIPMMTTIFSLKMEDHIIVVREGTRLIWNFVKGKGSDPTKASADTLTCHQRTTDVLADNLPMMHQPTHHHRIGHHANNALADIQLNCRML